MFGKVHCPSHSAQQSTSTSTCPSMPVICFNHFPSGQTVDWCQLFTCPTKIAHRSALCHCVVCRCAPHPPLAVFQNTHHHTDCLQCAWRASVFRTHDIMDKTCQWSRSCTTMSEDEEATALQVIQTEAAQRKDLGNLPLGKNALAGH